MSLRDGESDYERRARARRQRLHFTQRPCRTCGQWVKPVETRDHGRKCTYCESAAPLRDFLLRYGVQS